MNWRKQNEMTSSQRVKDRSLNLRRLKQGDKRSRQAVSEIMGAIVLIGVTLSVGFAAWAWSSSAARTAEKNLGNSVTENFEIVNVNFSSTKTTVVFYNEGSSTAYITSIVVQNSTDVESTNIFLSFTNSSLSKQSGPNCSHCAPLSPQTITFVTINLATGSTCTSSRLCVGQSYTFIAVGEYGNVAQYQEVR